MKKISRTLPAALLSLAVLAGVLAAPAAAQPKDTRSNKPALEECSDPLVPLLWENSGWRKKNLRMAWAIAMRESGGDETLVSDINPDSYGLFQLDIRIWGDTGYWPGDPLDGAQNAAATYAIWQDEGWLPWGLNADGTFAEHLYPPEFVKKFKKLFMKPYRSYYKAFPTDCAAWLKRK